MGKSVWIGLVLAALSVPSAFAEGGATDIPALSPFTASLSDTTLSLSGSAQATTFSAFVPGTKTALGASGAATFAAGLERATDSGFVYSLQSSFEVYHDRLSGDNYGSDLVQKVFGKVQTGLGSLEVGMNDGAAFALATGGPTVDAETGLDNPNAGFFRDPTTGRPIEGTFALNGAVESSYNFAKFSYYTPKLFGVQIGASYTPAPAKDVLPFVSVGPVKTDRQDSIWETAVRYDDSFGRLAVQLSGGAAFAHLDAATSSPGHTGLTDWAVGSQVSYALDDATKFSLGGSHHRTNAYAFDPTNVLADGTTRSTHLGVKLENGPWAFGLEYGNGAADGSRQQSDLKLEGFGAALGVTLNDNWAGTLGWQELRYSRDSGAYYTGNGKLDQDALYLHLHFQVQ